MTQRVPSDDGATSVEGRLMLVRNSAANLLAQAARATTRSSCPSMHRTSRSTCKAGSKECKVGFHAFSISSIRVTAAFCTAAVGFTICELKPSRCRPTCSSLCLSVCHHNSAHVSCVYRGLPSLNSCPVCRQSPGSVRRCVCVKTENFLCDECQVRERAAHRLGTTRSTCLTSSST